MNREPETTFQEMMVAIGDSLSGLGSSDDVEDGEDEDDEETEQCQLNKDDKPGWVIGTITKTVRQRMERFRQMQKKLEDLTQLGWEDAADYFRERDMTYGSSALRVLAVVQPQTADNAVVPALATIGELMECLDIVPGILQMPQGTSRPGSSHIRLGSVKPLSNTSISGLAPAAKPDSSLIQKVNPVELISFYPCIYPPQLFTI